MVHGIISYPASCPPHWTTGRRPWRRGPQTVENSSKRHRGRVRYAV